MRNVKALHQLKLHLMLYQLSVVLDESFLFFNISNCPLHKIRRLVAALPLEVLELRGALMFKLFLALIDFLRKYKKMLHTKMIKAIPKTMM
ncbi:hypothetical protein D3C75_901580 [compost metagenome]